MEDNKLTQKKSPKEKKAALRQRKEDRRKVPSKGYARMPMVGWICRREQCRRSDDKMDWIQ